MTDWQKLAVSMLGLGLCVGFIVGVVTMALAVQR